MFSMSEQVVPLEQGSESVIIFLGWADRNRRPPMFRPSERRLGLIRRVAGPVQVGDSVDIGLHVVREKIRREEVPLVEGIVGVFCSRRVK